MSAFFIVWKFFLILQKIWSTFHLTTKPKVEDMHIFLTLESLKQWLCSWKQKGKRICPFLFWSRWNNIFPGQKIETDKVTCHFSILPPSFWGLTSFSLCSQRIVMGPGSCYFWVTYVCVPLAFPVHLDQLTLFLTWHSLGLKSTCNF